MGGQRDVLWSVSPNGVTLRQVGEACELVFGVPPEELHRNPNAWLESIDERDRTALIAALSMAATGPQSVTYRLAGEPRWIHTVCRMSLDANGNPAKIDCISRDITTQRNASTTLEAEFGKSQEMLRREAAEKQKLQEQLVHAQKLDGIGRLAGGIAHDFNNLLTGVLGYAEIAMARLPEDSPALKDLKQIQLAAERGANMVRQLLTFARKQAVQPQIVDVGQIAANLEALLSRMISEQVVLTTMSDPELWSVTADPGQIEQVMMNLVVNARDAMPNGGSIVVQTSNVSLEGGVASLDLPPGDYVLMSVADNGTGMDQETVSRIFEPFFTTKEQGKGTGLGLSTCYGIIRQAGGHIWVYSEVGQGTTFKVYLPRTLAKGEQVSPALEAAPSGEAKGTIVLVEDEPMVRTLSVEGLRVQGYTVLSASNGREALDLILDHMGEIELLVTDVVMPEMGGRELAEQVIAARPQIKVLYTSGYADDAIVLHGMLDPGSAFLQKPYSPSKLAAKVQEVLAPVRLAA